MLTTFPIDFLRQIFEQTLYKEHLRDNSLFGGKDQVNILSFYEQLKNQDEVDRFVETYRDLADQQNRTGLILNGVLVSPENPTYTNLYSATIIPMTFTCSLRCQLSNRDQGIVTINNLIEELKGRKVDIAQLHSVDENGNKFTEPFVVGTIGENDGAPQMKNGDYIGEIVNSENASNEIIALVYGLYQQGVAYSGQTNTYFYVTSGGKLKVALFSLSGGSPTASIVEDDGTIDDILFPPEHTGFDKYKCSLSFDAIRCDEPRNLNGEEYCELSFAGSATLVSNGVQLGNDLLKISITRLGIQAESYIDFTQQQDNETYWLEPLEMPSGNNVNTEISQLMSNKFLTNTHSDALALTLQYTFIADFNNELLKKLFKYARYGTQGITKNDISPNMIFGVNEIWCSWGVFENEQYKAKIVENIDIDNTESDTLTISVQFQLQGDNN